MYREKGTDKLVFLPETVVGFEINRGKRGLPVVTVHNFGIEVKKRHDFKYRSRKERKSFAVVEISVATRTLEIELVIYKVISYSVLFVREHAAVLVTPGKMYVQIAQIRKVFSVLLFYVRIERNYHPYVEFARLCKRRGERANNLRKTACLNKGRRFRSDEKNFLLLFYLYRFRRGFFSRRGRALLCRGFFSRSRLFCCRCLFCFRIYLFPRLPVFKYASPYL